jgi:hypothetical protein
VIVMSEAPVAFRYVEQQTRRRHIQESSLHCNPQLVVLQLDRDADTLQNNKLRIVVLQLDRDADTLQPGKLQPLLRNDRSGQQLHEICPTSRRAPLTEQGSESGRYIPEGSGN